MAWSQPRNSQPELSGRLQTLMLLRVLFVSLLLGASIFIQVRETQTYFGYIQTVHYLLIAAIYFLTFVYAVIFKYSKGLLWLAYSQLLLDTLFTTAIIYATGGMESIFSFLFILTIINSSIMLYRKGGLVIASSSGLLYSLLLCLHSYNIIHPLGSRGPIGPQYQGLYLFYLILVNIAGFFLVAFLISYLSERLRKSRVELKAKQIDINKLEVLNENIINSITSGLIVLDDHHKIILFNPAAEAFFGIKAGDATGRPIHQVLPFLEDYLTEGDLLSNDKPAPFPPFLELPCSLPDGEKSHLQLSISPLNLPLGDQQGHILIFQDMTEIREIEEEMKRVEGLALIGELSAGIAHEIRNPMASISGSIQMLRDSLEEDDVNRRLMDIITREINRLNDLVNDFLEFTRPKKGKLEDFDLNQLISESLELFKNSRHWSSKIEVVTDFRRPIRLHSDPAQIKQVMWNLFLNASEAMPNGGSLGVAIDLDSDGAAPQGERAKVVVRDTGDGFDEATLPHLFTPFFTTKEGGSGLGLATVKKIIEGLQGEVTGSNHPEGGAEVTIDIPISPSGKLPIQ